MNECPKAIVADIAVKFGAPVKLIIKIPECQFMFIKKAFWKDCLYSLFDAVVDHGDFLIRLTHRRRKYPVCRNFLLSLCRSPGVV
jgi:hypothetical protein